MNSQDALILRAAMRGERLLDHPYRHENPSEIEYEMTRSGSGFMDTLKSGFGKAASLITPSQDTRAGFGKKLGSILSSKVAQDLAKEALPKLGEFITRKYDPSIERAEKEAAMLAEEEARLSAIKKDIDRIKTMKEYEKVSDSSASRRDEELERLKKEVAESRLRTEIEKIQKDPNALRITYGGNSIALSDLSDAQLDAVKTAHQLSKEIKGSGIIGDIFGSIF
jgi:ribosomal protein L29